ncbi:MAG: DUF3098 domain-containing protein [Bacteroidota bacterium]
MEDKKKQFGFQPENYRLLLVGLLINVVGYLLMIGGAAKSLNEFNENELFSTVRITLAPILIVAGFVIIFYAIMRKRKKSND